MLLHVHRNGCSGSPRAVGSTNAANAADSPGCLSRARLRPPTGLRIRPGANVAPRAAMASNSRRPLLTVAEDIPVAAITAATPPQPRDRASVAAHSRRDRSFSDPFIASYLSRSHSTIIASAMPLTTARDRRLL